MFWPYVQSRRKLHSFNIIIVLLYFQCPIPQASKCFLSLSEAALKKFKFPMLKYLQTKRGVLNSTMERKEENITVIKRTCGRTMFQTCFNSHLIVIATLQTSMEIKQAIGLKLHHIDISSILSFPRVKVKQKKL